MKNTRANGDYFLPVASFRDSVNTFFYRIGMDLFQEYSEKYISECDVEAKCRVEKTPTCMVVNTHLNGKIVSKCDRCGEPLSLAVDRRVQVILKFIDEEEVTHTEGEEGRETEVYYVKRSQPYFDMSEIFHDFIMLSIAGRKVHGEGECSPEFEEIFKKYDSERLKSFNYPMRNQIRRDA